MRARELYEATAEDLFRKIDALDAMINDKAATQGEKDNATKLKANLEQKLKQEFPGAVKPTPKPFGGRQTQYPDDWFSNMAKAAAAAQKQEDEWKKNPEAKTAYYRDRLEKLKMDRKHYRVGASMGNVEAAQMVRDLNYEIERIYREHFPAEWQEILKKREKASDAGYDRRDREMKAKRAKVKANMKRAGKMTTKEAGKLYPDVVKKAKKLSKAYGNDLGSVLYRLSEMNMETMRKFALGLTADELAQLVEMINLVSSEGGLAAGKNDGIAPAKKERILKGLDVGAQRDAAGAGQIGVKSAVKELSPVLKEIQKKAFKWKAAHPNKWCLTDLDDIFWNLATWAERLGADWATAKEKKQIRDVVTTVHTLTKRPAGMGKGFSVPRKEAILKALDSSE